MHTTYRGWPCCNHSKIRETLNNLILKSPDEWQTTVALPFVRIEGTTVEWDELKFDVRLLQRVPVSFANLKLEPHPNAHTLSVWTHGAANVSIIAPG
jgi:hypothetical protein